MMNLIRVNMLENPLPSYYFEVQINLICVNMCSGFLMHLPVVNLLHS